VESLWSRHPEHPVCLRYNISDENQEHWYHCPNGIDKTAKLCQDINRFLQKIVFASIPPYLDLSGYILHLKTLIPNYNIFFKNNHESAGRNFCVVELAHNGPLLRILSITPMMEIQRLRECCLTCSLRSINYGKCVRKTFMGKILLYTNNTSTLL
jgi:hypothetical protein